MQAVCLMACFCVLPGVEVFVGRGVSAYTVSQGQWSRAMSVTCARLRK